MAREELRCIMGCPGLKKQLSGKRCIAPMMQEAENNERNDVIPNTITIDVLHSGSQ